MHSLSRKSKITLFENEIKIKILTVDNKIKIETSAETSILRTRLKTSISTISRSRSLSPGLQDFFCSLSDVNCALCSQNDDDDVVVVVLLCMVCKEKEFCTQQFMKNTFTDPANTRASNKSMSICQLGSQVNQHNRLFLICSAGAIVRVYLVHLVSADSAPGGR